MFWVVHAKNAKLSTYLKKFQLKENMASFGLLINSLYIKLGI